jgi:hypothetical protein
MLSGNANITTLDLQEVKVIVNNGISTKKEIFTFLVNSTVQTQELSAGLKVGINFINNATSAIFNLYAPIKIMFK